MKIKDTFIGQIVEVQLLSTKRIGHIIDLDVNSSHETIAIVRLAPYYESNSIDKVRINSSDQKFPFKDLKPVK